MSKLEALIFQDGKYFAVFSHLLFQISTAMTVTMSTKAANAPHTAYKAVLLSDVDPPLFLPSSAFSDSMKLTGPLRRCNLFITS